MSEMHIVRGSTYRDTLRWATSECRFVAATLVPAAPLRFSAPDHGVPDGWQAKVEGSRDIDESERYPLKVIDADTLEISCVNGRGFKAGPVVIRINKPVELGGYKARMQIRDRVGGVVLLELTSEGFDGEPRILIDDDAKIIIREIPAAVTEAIVWKRGVFDLEMVMGDYVIKIDAGAVKVEEEITK